MDKLALALLALVPSLASPLSAPLKKANAASPPSIQRFCPPIVLLDSWVVVNFAVNATIPLYTSAALLVNDTIPERNNAAASADFNPILSRARAPTILTAKEITEVSSLRLEPPSQRDTDLHLMVHPGKDVASKRSLPLPSTFRNALLT
jgi:hypothetical protein